MSRKRLGNGKSDDELDKIIKYCIKCTLNLHDIPVWPLVIVRQFDANTLAKCK